MKYLTRALCNTSPILLRYGDEIKCCVNSFKPPTFVTTDTHRNVSTGLRARNVHCVVFALACRQAQCVSRKLPFQIRYLYFLCGTDVSLRLKSRCRPQNYEIPNNLLLKVSNLHLSESRPAVAESTSDPGSELKHSQTLPSKRSNKLQPATFLVCDKCRCIVGVWADDVLPRRHTAHSKFIQLFAET